MKKVIWKFPIEIQPYCEISMPKDAQILDVQEQFNDPMLWALVDPDKETEVRRFAVVSTGHEIPEIVTKVLQKYIGTFQTYGGNYVFHVFELSAS